MLQGNTPSGFNSVEGKVNMEDGLYRIREEEKNFGRTEREREGREQKGA
jgi:hypothetical protein